MSKNWYPVINEDLCIDCGACTEKCAHGVYDAQQAPHPVVVYPDGCIEGCHGCGSLCPTGAITYFGEAVEASCGDGCSCAGGCGGE